MVTYTQLCLSSRLQDIAVEFVTNIMIVPTAEALLHVLGQWGPRQTAPGFVSEVQMAMLALEVCVNTPGIYFPQAHEAHLQTFSLLTEGLTERFHEPATHTRKRRHFGMHEESVVKAIRNASWQMHEESVVEAIREASCQLHGVSRVEDLPGHADHLEALHLLLAGLACHPHLLDELPRALSMHGQFMKQAIRVQPLAVFYVPRRLIEDFSQCRPPEIE
jgi:hypothetical protein